MHAHPVAPLAQLGDVFIQRVTRHYGLMAAISLLITASVRFRGRHGKWDRDVDRRPASHRTVDSHLAAEHVNAVFKPDDPGAFTGVGSTYSVVANRQVKVFVGGSGTHRDFGGLPWHAPLDARPPARAIHPHRHRMGRQAPRHHHPLTTDKSTPGRVRCPMQAYRQPGGLRDQPNLEQQPDSKNGWT